MKLVQQAWSVPVVVTILMHGVCAASGEWKEDVKVDRSTGERTAVMTNAALNSVQQFSRKVSATLLLRCTETAGRTKQPTAAIIFSERVGMGAVRTKYRIDNDQIQRNKMASVQDDGFALGLGWTEFMSRLPSSSILRIEFSLPWAGAALIEFDTTGANEAFRRIPCTNRKQKDRLAAVSPISDC
ncbi:MAG TPA: hypothetical protein VEJ43_13540 [Pseudolabrys sp.]|nr:hypothetical protein [Pseudolabrys sp.]